MKELLTGQMYQLFKLAHALHVVRKDDPFVTTCLDRFIGSGAVTVMSLHGTRYLPAAR